MNDDSELIEKTLAELNLAGYGIKWNWKRNALARHYLAGAIAQTASLDYHTVLRYLDTKSKPQV